MNMNMNMDEYERMKNGWSRFEYLLRLDYLEF